MDTAIQVQIMDKAVRQTERDRDRQTDKDKETDNPTNTAYHSMIFMRAINLKCFNLENKSLICN